MSIQYTADQLQRKFNGQPGSPGFPRIADVLRRDGRVDEAIRLCQDGLLVRPNSLSAYLVLGKSLLEAGRIEEAREPFEAALRLDPRCLSALRHLADIMNRLQWAEAAAGYYRSILELEPWDAEIRGLLDGSASGSGTLADDAGSPGMAAMPAHTEAAPSHAEEDTFLKPEGMDGDVLELNLNDMASDFLPGAEGPETGALGLAEESLEDALENAARPSEDQEAPGERRSHPPASDRPAEPRPMDILSEAEPAAGESLETAEPPISGRDVEDRLDSLFGSEDGPVSDVSASDAEASSLQSSTATWTAAPSEPVVPDFPAAGETGMADLADTQDAPAAPEVHEAHEAHEAQAAPEAISVDDYSAVDFVSPEPGPVPESELSGSGDPDRVQGEDIERRLDELFNLTEEETRLPAPAFDASSLPVAPGPKIGEAVSMGEAVPFGGDAAAVRGADFPYGDAETQAEAREPVVTGQDVADKLDNLFGAEPVAGPEAAGMGAGSDTLAAATSEAPLETPAFPEPKPWTPDAGDSRPAPEGDVMSTESMLPPGWFGVPDVAGGESGDGPAITGSDVEDQLDRLFGLEAEGKSGEGAADGPAAPAISGGDEPAGGDDVNTGDTATFRIPTGSAEGGSAEGARVPETGSGAPGDGSDMTLLMPAMRDPDAEMDASRAASLGFDAGETMILPNEDAESFGALAPDELSAISETAAIEMVDGDDVAGRLDELFADAVQPAGLGIPEGELAPMEMEMPLFTGETETSQAAPALDGTAGGHMVSGEDVSSRLDALFETGETTGENAGSAPEAQTETGVPAVTETDDERLPSAAPVEKPLQVAPELAPMMDEEDGYPEEEEMPADAATGANVATVTLAEIYFQQGLREQALQIYRQLLEREPDNESVRKRIDEIEAAKPEGGDRGPGSDPRRPRPGLKVPKRKK